MTAHTAPATGLRSRLVALHGTDTVITVPARQLAAIAHPVDPYDDWAAVIDAFAIDPVESDTVATLTDRFRRNGTFLNPVRLGWDCDWDDAADDYVDTDRILIANGHHRMCVAITEDADIPVGWTLPPPTDDEPFAITDIPVHIDRTPTEELDDVVFSALRSFPDGDGWVEALGMGGQSGPDGACYTVTFGDEHDPARLPGLLRARLDRFGLTDVRVGAPTTSVIEPYM